jgi:hypothetical protein
MPRGSWPGERRGGRQRGTPNKRTVLTERILAAASANPKATSRELLSILVGDEGLPADTRIAIAQKESPRATSQKNRSGSKKSGALAARPVGSSIRRDVRANGNGPVLRSPAVRRTDPVTFATVDLLLKVAQATIASPEHRHEAASKMAEYFLPKRPRRRKFPVDECGFSVDPELARELCDAKLKLAFLPFLQTITHYTRVQRTIKLQARIAEIQQSLQCPCPSQYKRKHLRLDSRRLGVLTRKRAAAKELTPEEDAELIRRMARPTALSRAQNLGRGFASKSFCRRNAPPIRSPI